MKPSCSQRFVSHEVHAPLFEPLFARFRREPVLATRLAVERTGGAAAELEA
jgi:hypothetical protein